LDYLGDYTQSLTLFAIRSTLLGKQVLVIVLSENTVWHLVSQDHRLTIVSNDTATPDGNRTIMEGIKEVVDHHLEIKLIQHLLVMRLLLVVQSDHVQTRTVPTEVLRDRLLDVCNIVLSWGFEIAREVVDDINPTAGGKGRQSDHDRSSRQLPVYFLQSLTLE
jgi:hypothetical protein